MRLLSVTVFMGSALWACALFLYQWTHDGLTAMETLKATPEALREMSVGAMFATFFGAAIAWRVIEYESRKRREPKRPPTLHILHGDPSGDSRGNYSFTPEDGGRKARITGWYEGLQNGDWLALWNKRCGHASRYRIVRLEYRRDPSDMFHADLVHDPIQQGEYYPGECPACGAVDCRTLCGDRRAYCSNCGRTTTA